MLEDKKVTIVRTDDWIGIYIDGTLATEKHSLRPHEVLNVLGVKFKMIDLEEWQMQEVGNRLPPKLKDLTDNVWTEAKE